MSIQTAEYIDVQQRAVELGCNVPTKLAFLPINFEEAKINDDLVFEDSVLTLRKLWRKAGIAETRIEKEGKQISYEQKKSLDVILPTVFISFSLLSQNPTLVTLALSIISNYVTDFFKGMIGERKIMIDIVVEQDEEKKSKRIRYEGNAEGLTTLAQVIKELKDL